MTRSRVLVRPGATFGRWTVLCEADQGRYRCECACGRVATVVGTFLRADAFGCGVCARLFKASAERARERAARVPQWTPEQLAEWALGPFRIEDAQVIA